MYVCKKTSKIACIQTVIMNVQILSKHTIKPSAPTPHHLRNYKLSLLDQFAPSLYVPFIFFYPNKISDQDTITTSSTGSGTIFLSRLKESLSQILTIYYPLAGRLRDCVSVVCNDEGVDFTEAQAKGSTLSEFLKKPDIAALNNFLPCNGDGLEKGTNIAPAMIKATIFEECGGIVIGVCIFHRIGDAGTAAVFLNDWAKMARAAGTTSNELLLKIIPKPNFTSGSTTFPPRESLTSDFVKDFDNFYFQGDGTNNNKSLTMRRYLFDDTAIKTLRKKATSEKVPNPSRVEVLTAFVVKHMNNAAEAVAGASRKSSQDPMTLMITHAVNLRQRIEPPLPNKTFGNILWVAFSFYECTRSQLNNNNSIINPVDLVEILREAFASLNKESISELETDDAFTALSELLESVYTNQKIRIYRFTSWCNLGFYDIDFGWGNPIWVAHMGNMIAYRPKQQFVFIESTNGKGIELWLAADEQQLSILEKATEFLAYVSPNPSIFVDSSAESN